MGFVCIRWGVFIFTIHDLVLFLILYFLGVTLVGPCPHNKFWNWKQYECIFTRMLPLPQNIYYWCRTGIDYILYRFLHILLDITFWRAKNSSCFIEAPYWRDELYSGVWFQRSSTLLQHGGLFDLHLLRSTTSPNSF